MACYSFPPILRKEFIYKASFTISFEGQTLVFLSVCSETENASGPGLFRSSHYAFASADCPAATRGIVVLRMAA